MCLSMKQQTISLKPILEKKLHTCTFTNSEYLLCVCRLVACLDSGLWSAHIGYYLDWGLVFSRWACTTRYPKATLQPQPLVSCCNKKLDSDNGMYNKSINLVHMYAIIIFFVQGFFLFIFPSGLFLFQEMLDVPILFIFLALIPATMIAVLYYFDHSVASQLAQQREFNLRKPSSYHYDLLLLAALV